MSGTIVAKIRMDNASYTTSGELPRIGSHAPEFMLVRLPLSSNPEVNPIAATTPVILSVPACSVPVSSIVARSSNTRPNGPVVMLWLVVPSYSFRAYPSAVN